MLYYIHKTFLKELIDIMKIQKTESSTFELIDPQIEDKVIYFGESVIKILREEGKLEKEINESSLDEWDIKCLREEGKLNKDIYELAGIGKFHFKLDQDCKIWTILESSHSLIEGENDYVCYYSNIEFFEHYNKEENSIICSYYPEYKKLQKILNDVYKNLIEAKYYINVSKKLMTEKYKNPQKLYNADYFWSMTIIAFRKLGILLLATVYDNDKNSISLNKLLNIISSINGKKLLSHFSDLDQKELDRDKEYLDKNENELLQKLFNQRDKALAHHDKDELFKLETILNIKRRNETNKSIMDTLDSSLEKPSEKTQKLMQRLNTQESNQLIDKGIEICNKYSNIINYDLPDYNIPEDYHNLLNYKNISYLIISFLLILIIILTIFSFLN